MSVQELKIALIGSAPTSIRLAPYHDPSWKVWGCSPGTYGVMPRVDAFFELHLWEPGQPWFSPEYVQWLKALPGRDVALWVGSDAAAAQVPGAKSLPVSELIKKYDPERWYWTSSLSWMMAMAIEAEATKIGLWGIDMAACEEYEIQRSGIHYFTKIAKGLGIEVGVPAESDLFTPRFLYGVDEWTHSFRKGRARDGELSARLADAQNRAAAATQEVAFLHGARDDLKYMRETWSDKGTYTGPLPAHAGEVLPKMPPMAEAAG